MNNSPKQHQILLVDDEAIFLEAIRELLITHSKSAWQIDCANSADQALELLKNRKFNLIVVDVDMPVLDGVQFVGLLNRRYPELKKAVLTGHATEEKRSTCLANGVELFIEKPRTAEGLKSIFTMLDELVSWTPRDGFEGVLRKVGIQEVIQMECLGRNSSILEIYNQETRGKIYIENGGIIHAAVGELVGEAALQKLLALPSGGFQLHPFAAPPQRTIAGPWEFLLMEAARVRDENATQNPAAETESAVAAPGLQVVETLICSGRGETLYASPGLEVGARVSLLQSINRQAASLNALLSLGNFDRLEIQLDGSRAVAQLRNDRMVFVRVATGETKPQEAA